MKVIPWTNEEIEILRELYADGNVLANMNRLPGRTIDAAWRKATKLGIKWKITWTPEEDDIIRAGYTSGTPLKELLKLLPVRSHKGVRDRAARLGLTGTFNGPMFCTFSWIAEAAKKELSAGTPMTAVALTERVGATKASMYRVLRKLHGNGAYIADWEHAGNGYSAMWALGDLPDSVKPETVSIAQRARIRRKSQSIKQGRLNPFAAAAGLVTIPEGQRGRVFQQSMSIRDDEEIAA